jgi:hypothetical protein
MSVVALQPEATIAVRTDLDAIFVSIAKPNEFDGSPASSICANSTRYRISVPDQMLNSCARRPYVVT